MKLKSNYKYLRIHKSLLFFFVLTISLYSCQKDEGDTTIKTINSQEINARDCAPCFEPGIDGFSYEKVSCENECVFQFTPQLNETSSEITKYFWEFGDGTTSMLPNPTHTYAEEGIYNVNLRVTHFSECCFEVNKDVECLFVPTNYICHENLINDEMECAHSVNYIDPNTGNIETVAFEYTSYYLDFDALSGLIEGALLSVGYNVTVTKEDPTGTIQCYKTIIVPNSGEIIFQSPTYGLFVTGEVIVTHLVGNDNFKYNTCIPGDQSGYALSPEFEYCQ